MSLSSTPTLDQLPDEVWQYILERSFDKDDESLRSLLRTSKRLQSLVEQHLRDRLIRLENHPYLRSIVEHFPSLSEAEPLQRLSLLAERLKNAKQLNTDWRYPSITLGELRIKECSLSSSASFPSDSISLPAINKCTSELTECTNSAGYSLLFLTAARNNEPIDRFRLDWIQSDAIDDAIYFSLTKGNQKHLQTLLPYSSVMGDNPNRAFGTLTEMMRIACLYDNPEALEYLLSLGGPFDQGSVKKMLALKTIHAPKETRQKFKEILEQLDSLLFSEATASEKSAPVESCSQEGLFSHPLIAQILTHPLCSKDPAEQAPFIAKQLHRAVAIEKLFATYLDPSMLTKRILDPGFSKILAAADKKPAPTTTKELFHLADQCDYSYLFLSSIVEGNLLFADRFILDLIKTPILDQAIHILIAHNSGYFQKLLPYSPCFGQQSEDHLTHLIHFADKVENSLALDFLIGLKRNFDHNILLAMFARNNKCDSIKKLLASHLNFDLTFSYHHYAFSGSGVHAALIAACDWGHLETLRTILQGLPVPRKILESIKDRIKSLYLPPYCTWRVPDRSPRIPDETLNAMSKLLEEEITRRFPEITS